MISFWRIARRCKWYDFDTQQLLPNIPHVHHANCKHFSEKFRWPYHEYNLKLHRKDYESEFTKLCFIWISHCYLDGIAKINVELFRTPYITTCAAKFTLLKTNINSWTQNESESERQRHLETNTSSKKHARYVSNFQKQRVSWCGIKTHNIKKLKWSVKDFQIKN